MKTGLKNGWNISLRHEENKNAWNDEEAFPGLEEWGGGLTYETLVLADYDWLESVLQPKLWYIPRGKEWRYKTNALNAMLNHYVPEYLPVIERACTDESTEVRAMAKWGLDRTVNCREKSD